MDVLLIYTGLLVMLAGFVSIIKPLGFLKIRNRQAGAVVLLFGLVLGVVGAMWPVKLMSSEGSHMRIDDLMPVYHFHEFHSTRVYASRERIFRAIKAVTPQEIRFFRTLMGIRGLPARLLGKDRPTMLMPNYHVKSYDQKNFEAHEFMVDSVNGKTKRIEGKKTSIYYEIKKGEPSAARLQIIQTYENAIKKMGGAVAARDSCCNVTLKLGAAIWIEVAAYNGGDSYRLTIVEEGGPAETRPLLDVLTGSGFLLLSEETDREIVVGTVNQYWKLTGGESPPRIPGPQDFLAFESPGYAKVTCNFTVKDEGRGRFRVTTETRIFATDASARRKFAVYWRLIYPGSAMIRRMWLDAIKQRAEHDFQ